MCITLASSLDTMIKHISELLLEMISEEEKLKSKLESNVETCRQELSKLQSDLQLRVEVTSY